MFCKRSNDDKTTAKISEALKHSTVTLNPCRQRRKMPVKVTDLGFEPESNQKKPSVKAGWTRKRHGVFPAGSSLFLG